MKYSELNEDGREKVELLLTNNKGRGGVVAGYDNNGVSVAERDMSISGRCIAYMVEDEHLFHLWYSDGSDGGVYEFISPLEEIPPEVLALDPSCKNGVEVAEDPKRAKLQAKVEEAQKKLADYDRKLELEARYKELGEANTANNAERTKIRQELKTL